MGAGDFKMQIKIRPHHFLCMTCFKGEGYSDVFTKNMAEIIQKLKNSDVKITITEEADSICTACPNKQNSICGKELKVQQLDQQHAAALGINNGESYSWQELQQLVCAKITVDKFHQICKDCSWKPAGICEQVITEFRK